MMSPPHLESQGFQFDATFLYLLFLIVLPSPVALSVLSFYAFGTLSRLLSLNLHFLKGRLFCVALVFCFFSG